MNTQQLAASFLTLSLIFSLFFLVCFFLLVFALDRPVPTAWRSWCHKQNLSVGSFLGPFRDECFTGSGVQRRNSTRMELTGWWRTNMWAGLGGNLGFLSSSDLLGSKLALSDLGSLFQQKWLCDSPFWELLNAIYLPPRSRVVPSK